MGDVGWGRVVGVEELCEAEEDVGELSFYARIGGGGVGGGGARGSGEVAEGDGLVVLGVLVCG